MDSRATTRARLTIIPVVAALMLNLLVPILSIAAPAAVPEPVAPQVASAASDPAHVNFTLQGCRNPSVNLEATNFICADGDYTTGNLGKTWNELDLVPHRMTTTLGSQDSATTTYTIGITADHMDGGAPGYDVLTAPVLNAAKSDASCSITVGAQSVIEPGVGGTDKSLGRLLTITQAKGSTCVFDWVERLALGSHLFPGASLHTNRTNQLWSTRGIGAADVSIPVNEILPQELSKDMTAERGQAYAWTIEKSADPSSLEFGNTCLDTAGARSQDVDITVTWTRTGPTAAGDTLLTTHVYATNPAHRSVIVNVTDRIYEGADQSVLLDTESSNPISVPAGAEDVLVLTHTMTYSGSATTFNDVATATYTDEDLGIAVPGQTEATASATTQASGGAIANASVLVTDVESISGTGLSFSVAAPSVGSFTGGYLAGGETTEPVNWQYTATNSGSVTFTKTVYVDEPRITNGSLSDTATIVGDENATLDSDSESVAITTDALVSLEITKSIPAGSLRSGESVTFDFDVSGPDSFADTASITFEFGDPLTKSTTLTDLAAGEYTVSEQPQPNWATHVDQVETITLPDCEGAVSFNNSTLAPDLSITKVSDDEVVSAGDQIGWTLEVTNSEEEGVGVAKDVELHDAFPISTLVLGWSIDDVSFDGVSVAEPANYCEITGDAPAQTLICDFGDLDPGASASVHVVSETAAPDGCETFSLQNIAATWASNHGEITATATITIECPDLSITKEADNETVDAGDPIGFSIVVSNGDAYGVGTATNVTLNDPLPGSLALGVDWSIEAVLFNGNPIADQDLCSISGDPASETLACEFGDMAPGDEYEVQLSSGTSAPDGCLTADLFNEATADADNHAAIDADATITVECPDLSITKEADAALVSAGEEIGFTVDVANASTEGTGTATGVTVEDELPGGDGISWSVAGVSINDVAAADPGAWCAITGSAPTQTLECDFGDLGAGDHASVHVVSDTTQDSCATYDNTAVADALNAAEVTSLEAQVTVECPGLNIVKSADADPIDAGEEASFTITVWNAGPGDAFDVTLEDTLPLNLPWDFEVVQGNAECGISAVLSLEDVEQRSIDCDLGTLEPSEMADGVIIRVFADTVRDDCGLLENEAFADASNHDEVSSEDEITVKCPEITLDKENDAVGSVLPGTTVTYALTLTVSDGPATDVMVVDVMPEGLENPTNISHGGTFSAATRTITWDLGDLADGEYELSYRAVVADDVENGDELVNAAAATSTNSQCPDPETLGPECEDESTVIVRVPTLVIDKVASTETIVISGPNDALVATPSIVTWTLTYTLANGPVTNAVITDPIPAGFSFLDASNGGTFSAGTVTWNLGTLTASGSVTFRTTVNPATISRVAPTVNIATIDSNETAPDTGQDSVTVSVEPPPLAGTPTPKPSLPDTASGFGVNGEPVTVPVELLAVVFLGSLGALALANARARTRRW